MIDMDALQAEDLSLRLSLHGRHLIEASAGTGKTFTIAGLYARLIAERDLPVREVLVITFTKAAAEELRQRLRQRLALCARWADSAAADPHSPLPELDDAESALALAVVRRVRARGEESAQMLARRLRMAVLDMDQAAIGTIDSFCQRALKTWSMYLDEGIENAELDPDDRKLLADFAADAWLRAAAEDAEPGLDSVKMLGGSADKLATLLNDLTCFDGTIEPEAPPAEAPGTAPDLAAADAALIAAWQGQGAAAMSCFESRFRAGTLHSGRYKEDKLASLQQLSAMFADGRVPPGKDLAPFCMAKLERDTAKAHKPFPEQPAFAAIDAWQAVQQAQQEVQRRAAVRSLHALVDQARDWLAGRKRDLRRMSYADPLCWLEHGVLHGSRRQLLIEALRGQCKVALIDEFQDTNPRQFRIFETLFGERGDLFLIGDPKQAIYGFRGGDVFAYLKAADAEAQAGRQIHTLKHNFRSSPGLLKAVAALFERPDPFAQKGITFEEVQAGGKVKDGQLRLRGAPVRPLNLWPVDKESLGGNADKQREGLAEVCAAQVAELVNDACLPDKESGQDKPLARNQIAVLVNKNSEALQVRDALERRGVPAVCVQRLSVYASREAGELLQLLDALLTPASLRLARGALATELLGRPLSDMAGAGDALRRALTELDELRAAWTRRGLMALLEAVTERHAARLLTLADGERRLVNLLQLAEDLAGEARRLGGGQALRDLLARRIGDADKYNEAEQLRLESDAERVQVLTVHGSKGLEYDVVLLPFTTLMENKSPARGQMAMHHDAHGAARATLLLRDSKAGTGKHADPVAKAEAEARAKAKDEDFAERLRLLYVGITRARHACWLGTGMGKVMGYLLADAGGAQALARKHPDVIACHPVQPGAAVAVPLAAAPAPAGARVFAGHIRRDWWQHSFSRLASGEHAGAAVPGAEDERDVAVVDAPRAEAAPVPTWPRGPRYGNVVHAVLEKTVMADWAVDVPDTGRKLIDRELRAAGWQGEELARAIEPTVQLVRQTLTTPILSDLRLPDLRLADLDPAARRAEMPFHFGIDGADPAQLLALLHRHGYQRGRAGFAHVEHSLRGLMTGIIDLVFRHAGQWWIVDYKTNLLGATGADYAAERLPAAIAAHDYDLQYLIYTVALHRWLGLMLGADYDYERDIGGVRYLFVRGMDGQAPFGHGIHAERPPRALIEAMDALLHAPGDTP